MNKKIYINFMRKKGYVVTRDIKKACVDIFDKDESGQAYYIRFRRLGK